MGRAPTGASWCLKQVGQVHRRSAAALDSFLITQGIPVAVAAAEAVADAEAEAAAAEAAVADADALDPAEAVACTFGHIQDPCKAHLRTILDSARNRHMHLPQTLQTRQRHCSECGT